MGRLLNIVNQLHRRTARDYIGRMTDEKVQKAIAQHPDLRRPNRIYVDTRDHTVYLTGAAYHPLAAENPQDLEGKVPVVSKVVNDIYILQGD